MIQSVCNHDYRDPKKTTKMRCEVEEGKLKSHLERQNSAEDGGKCLQVEKKEAKIDFLSVGNRQEKSKVVGDTKLSCSCLSKEIINSCHNHRDKRLFKSQSTPSGRERIDPDEKVTNPTFRFVRNVETRSGGSKTNDCYEKRMFKFPYIDQITPRLASKISCLSVKSVRSEYQEEFSKIGSLIMKYKLHDHSNCNKGAKCKHELNELNHKLKHDNSECTIHKKRK